MRNAEQDRRSNFTTRLLSVSLASIVSVFLFAGCGSDSATNVNLGSPTDPDFVEVQGAFGNFLDSAYVAFTSGYGVYNNLPTAGGSVGGAYGPINPGAGDIATHEYSAEGWHKILVIVNNGEVLWQVRDSIQFVKDNVPQQAAADCDLLDYRHQWSVTPLNQAGNYTTLDGAVSVVIDGLNTGSTSINGVYSFTRNDHSIAEGSGDQTDNNFEIVSTFNDVVVDKPGTTWGSGCPRSGNISFQVNQTKTVTVGDRKSVV